MNDFQNQVSVWMKDTNVCTYVKWDKSISQDQTSCTITAKLSVKMDGIKKCELQCQCITENSDNAIRSAVEAISEKIVNRLSDIDSFYQL